MKRFAVLLMGTIVFSPLCPVQAQNANGAAKQALTAAVQSAAIEGEGAAPFRLTAKYETFDFMGRPASSGTLQEVFLKPGMRKRTLTEGGTVDKFSPDDALATVADQAPANGYMERLLAEALLSPGPSLKDIDAGTLKAKERKFGDVALNCVALDGPKLAGDFQKLQNSHLYCLDEKSPLLRTSEQQYGLLAVYNKVVKFGDHTISEDMTIQQRGKTRAHVQVVSIVAAPELKESDFPKEATPAERAPMDSAKKGAVRLGSGVAAGNIINKVNPIYPESAKAKHIAGVVVLSAVIGRDGLIKNLDVISAPADDLAESAIAAVSQWRYKPYLLNGELTEVDTTITVNYSFWR